MLTNQSTRRLQTAFLAYIGDEGEGMEEPQMSEDFGVLPWGVFIRKYFPLIIKAGLSTTLALVLLGVVMGWLPSYIRDGQERLERNEAALAASEQALSDALKTHASETEDVLSAYHKMVADEAASAAADRRLMLSIAKANCINDAKRPGDTERCESAFRGQYP